MGSNATVGPADGDMLVQLAPDHSGSTWDYVRTLRKTLPEQFPGVTFFFQPADMVNQVLNLGRPAPIDVQISGQNRAANYEVAREFSAIATYDEKLALMRCLFAVSATDESISTAEESEIHKIANELRIDHPDLVALRVAHQRHLPGLRQP